MQEAADRRLPFFRIQTSGGGPQVSLHDNAPLNTGSIHPAWHLGARDRRC
jgi:hypothetical protein